jgi:hypothetical protein
MGGFTLMDINQITFFLGWCTVINLSIYAFSALVLFAFKNHIINLHSKLSGVNASILPTQYFQYLANYKIAIIVFNLVPYIALNMMV